MVERSKLIGKIPVQALDAYTAQATVRRAIGSSVMLATDLQRRFASLFPASGVYQCSSAGIGSVAENLVARGSLVVVDLGPAACVLPAAPQNLPVPNTCTPLFSTANPVTGGLGGAARFTSAITGHPKPPSQNAPAPAAYTDKLGVVLAGIRDVPRDSIEAEFRKDFDDLKSQLTSSRGLVGMIVFVLGAWAASQLAPPVGWIIDGVLLGIAISAMGWAAFDWFKRVAALLLRIDRAQTIPELKACSVELVNLIIAIGMSVFVALVTRAAARKLPKVGGKAAANPSEPLSRAQPSRPVPGKAEPTDAAIAKQTAVASERPINQSGAKTNVNQTFDFQTKQLQAKFKHAADFGVEGPYNRANAAKFEAALRSHVSADTTRIIAGTYRGTSVTHFVDPHTGLNIMRGSNGNFISGWRLTPDQLKNVLQRGKM